MTVHAFLVATILALVGRVDGSYIQHVSDRAGPRAWAEQLAWHIEDAATLHGVDPALLTALYYHESRFYERARSKSGARGISQINPRAWPRKWRAIAVAPKAERTRLQVLHGASILRHYAMKCGASWRAVSAYRSGRCMRQKSRNTRKVMATYRSIAGALRSSTRPTAGGPAIGSRGGDAVPCIRGACG